MRIRFSLLRRIAQSGVLPSWLVKAGAVIVSIPLIIVGFFALLATIAAWAGGDSLQTMGGAALIAVTTYGAAGFCLIKAWRYRQHGNLSDDQAAREPWKRRPGWQKNAIEEGSSGGVFGKVALAAILWNAISWPVAINYTNTFLESSTASPLVLLVWGFPAVGIGLAGRWGYKLLRRGKYGASTFEMATLPGEIGGTVRGAVKTKMKTDDAPEGGFTVKLGCYRREVYYRRDNDGDRRRKVRLDEVWSQRQTVQPQTDSGGRLSVPVDFHVPPGMDASTPTKRPERLLWRLDVETDVPGIDYEAQFEIPVFDVSTASATRPSENLSEDTARVSAENDASAPSANQADAPAARDDSAEPFTSPAVASGGFTEAEPESARGDDRDESKRKPWTYRDAWTDGRIQADENGDSLMSSFLGALIPSVVGFSMIIYFTFFADYSEQGVIFAAVMGGVFALVGVLIMSKTVLRWLRKRRYGKTTFEMDDVPAALGGVLSGTVATRVKADDAPADGFHVQLSCYERRLRRDSEGHKDVDLDLFWRDEKHIKGRPRSDDPQHLALPMFFECPDDQPASTPVKKPNRILWRLDVEADVPGVDYSAQMEVPVFDVPERRTAQREPEAPSEDGLFWEMSDGKQEKTSGLQREDTAPDGVENPYADHEITKRFTEPVSKGITMERTPGGSLAFYFGAARSWGTALTLTVLCLVMVGFLAAMVYNGTLSLIAWLVVPLFAFLTGYGAFRYWTYASSVHVENGQITVREGPFGRGSPNTLSHAALADVEVATTGATSGLLASNKTSYEIRLIRSGDEAQAQENTQKVTAFIEKVGVNTDGSTRRRMERAQKNSQHLVAARHLRNHEEADWIADQIQTQAAEQARWSG